MSFFTVGNLLTLGIVALAFILYHQLNRKNHALDKVREYSKRVKEDLASFVTEKEAAVRDYIVELGVQQQSAKELMRRLVVTDQEMADKAAAVAKLDERISAYDHSLQELIQMTGRVQENLNRIREESAFVENAAKRVSAAENKLQGIEQTLEEMERRFERENADALEQAVEATLASARSAVSDLQATAETIERQVEDHREALNKAEQERKALLARDLELVNKTLAGAVEKAGQRADKMEDAALVKLREQALERARRFHAAVEEKLKLYQEAARERTAEVQTLVRTYKDEWKNDAAQMEAKQRSYRDEWKKDIADLNNLARTMRDEWKTIAETGSGQSQEISAALAKAAADAEETLAAAAAAADQRLREAREAVEEAALKTGDDIHRILAEAETQARNQGEGELEKWRLEAEDLDARFRKALADFEAASAAGEEAAAARSSELLRALNDAAADREERISAQAGEQLRTLDGKTAAMEDRLDLLEKQIEQTEGTIEKTLAQAVEKAETRARLSADEELGKWKSAAEETFNRWKLALEEGESQARRLLAELSAASGEARQQVLGEIEALNIKLAESGRQAGEAMARLEQRLQEAREEVEEAALKTGEDIGRFLAEAETQARNQGERELEKWRLEAENLDARFRKALADFENASAAGEEAAAARSSELLRALNDAAVDREEQINAQAGEQLRTLDGKTAAVENRLDFLEKQIEQTEGTIEKTLAQAVEKAEARARLSADEELGKWTSGAEEAFNRWKLALEEGESQARRLLAELSAASGEARQQVLGEIEALNARLAESGRQTGEALARLEQKLVQAVSDTEQQVLEAADARFGEYREAQAQQYRRLETLAADAEKLDGELRRAMRDTEDRVRDEFALFERDAAQDREAAAAAFTTAVEALKGDMLTLEQDLAALKTRAYDNVSEKLQLFEDDFSGDLARRRDEADRRLAEWKINLDANLETLADEAGEERRKLELGFTEELKNQLADQRDRLITELEHLKAETAAFEEGVRNEMSQGEDSLRSFKDQLDENLAETRRAAELSVKAEIGRYALTAAETLKQAQRDLSSSLKELADQIETRSGELAGLQEGSRREMEEWQSAFSAQLRETDLAMEEVRRKIRELAAAGDERMALVRSLMEELREEAAAHRTEIFSRTDEQAKVLDSAIKEADRHIKEFVGQTKLFDQAGALKLDLERRIEDLRGDLDRIDQRRSEAADLEAQFVKIKRLEDEVNAKMTRFLSEKRRIELMESDFNRLLQTSQAVEEKLTQVSASDDALQAIQVQIRKLEDALGDTEEKYQRVERKNQILENTNQGIDRNFKALRDSEEALKRFNDDLRRLEGDQMDLRASVERLTAEHEKAREIAEKLSFLDEELSGVEKRIAEMQKAREWLARTETRLTELDKEIQGRVKLMDSMGKDEAVKGKSKGAPPIGIQDSIRSLFRQGWTAKEIASTYKLSIGEVELILEIGPKD
jgi:DNA repair exonuclease SbcCD ATPase subunit